MRSTEQEAIIDAWWHQQDLDERWLNEQAHITQERAMPKVSDMITSKYLKKEDFDEDQVCTIKGVSQENLGKDGQNELRWIIYFRERDKGLVLNITSIRVLEAAYGDDTDKWIGNKVMVYVDPNVSFGGKVVGGLRLRTPKKQSVQAPKPPVDDEFDNDSSIPF